MSKYNYKYSLKEDFFSIFVVILIIYTIAFFCFNFSYNFNQNQIGLFIAILFTVMGVLITVLTLLYAFQDLFRENEAMKYLFEQNQYYDISKRFIDSVFGIFYSAIILLILYFFVPSKSSSIIEINFYNFLILFFLAFAMLRVYWSFRVFRLLQEAIEAYRQRT